MIGSREWRFSAAGDPNGTRTRVFAVKGDSRLESTARPRLPDLFHPLRFNDLRGRGDVLSFSLGGTHV